MSHLRRGSLFTKVEISERASNMLEQLHKSGLYSGPTLGRVVTELIAERYRELVRAGIIKLETLHAERSKVGDPTQLADIRPRLHRGGKDN